MSYRAGLRASLVAGNQHCALRCATHRIERAQLLIRIACSNRKTKYF